MDLKANKLDTITTTVSPNTVVASEWNQLINEQNNLITSAGLTPSSSNLTQLKTAVTTIMPDGASHNGYFEEKNLGTWSSTIDVDNFITQNGISAGTFGNLKLGNYVTIQDGTYNKTWMIAGFDVHWNIGDTTFAKHHIAMVPRTNLMSAKMNETNITTGGYAASLMHTETIPTVVTNLQKVLGTHLLEHRRLISETVANVASGGYAGWTGASSDWEWQSMYACLLTEPQLYGTRVCSSSRFDVGEGWQQLPVYKFVTPNKYAREWWWLRAVATSTYFCACGYGGNASSSNASNSIGVRPLILIG